MSTGDRIKGKAKEVTGKITRNDELEAEGKMQKTKGKVGETVDRTRDKIKGAGKGLEGRDRDDDLA